MVEAGVALVIDLTCKPSRAVTVSNIGVTPYMGVPHRVTSPHLGGLDARVWVEEVEVLRLEFWRASGYENISEDSYGHCD